MGRRNVRKSGWGRLIFSGCPFREKRQEISDCSAQIICLSVKSLQNFTLNVLWRMVKYVQLFFCAPVVNNVVVRYRHLQVRSGYCESAGILNGTIIGTKVFVGNNSLIYGAASHMWFLSVMLALSSTQSSRIIFPVQLGFLSCVLGILVLLNCAASSSSW